MRLAAAELAILPLLHVVYRGGEARPWPPGPRRNGQPSWEGGPRTPRRPGQPAPATMMNSRLGVIAQLVRFIRLTCIVARLPFNRPPFCPTRTYLSTVAHPHQHIVGTAELASVCMCIHVAEPSSPAWLLVELTVDPSAD